MFHLIATALLLAANGQSAVLFDRETVVVTGDNSMGAGVIIGRDHGMLRILTAAHVANVRNVQVVFFGGQPETETPSRVEYDVNKDIAVIYVHAMYAYPVAPIAQTLPAAQSTVTVVGHPLGNLYTHSAATVIGFYGVAPLLTPVLTCETCDHGDSGGGVFDSHGALIGVISMRAQVRASGGMFPANGALVMGWFPDALADINAFLATH